jgi:type IV secretory pathway TrbD component
LVGIPVFIPAVFRSKLTKTILTMQKNVMQVFKGAACGPYLFASMFWLASLFSFQLFFIPAAVLFSLEGFLNLYNGHDCGKLVPKQF